MKFIKNPVFLDYYSKVMGILLFILKSIDISLLLKMKNGFSWPAKIMVSPFKYLPTILEHSAHFNSALHK